VAIQNSIATVYRVGQKTWTALRVGNFATVHGTKASDMLKVSQFCLQKSIELGCHLN